MKACRRKYIEWGAAGIGALALFLFFFRILPYHLFHREQTQLFLLATEPLAGYLRQMCIRDRKYTDKLHGSLKPGDVIYVDTDGDNVISAADKTNIGNPHPDINLGFSLSLIHI